MKNKRIYIEREKIIRSENEEKTSACVEGVCMLLDGLAYILIFLFRPKFALQKSTTQAPKCGRSFSVGVVNAWGKLREGGSWLSHCFYLSLSSV